MNSNDFSPLEFGRAFKRFIDYMSAQAPDEELSAKRLLRDHLGGDPTSLPVLSFELADHEHPNLQVAVDGLLDEGAWVGSIEPAPPELGSGLGGLAQAEMGFLTFGRAGPQGSLQFAEVELEPGRTIACVSNALLLLHHEGRPLASLISREDMGMSTGLRVEVVSPERSDGEQLLARLRELMQAMNVYRGRVLSFSGNGFDQSTRVRIERHPEVDRDEIVLPEGTLERVEREALAPSRHRDRLLAAGRHLKRGLLLHGPPGTGKTLTARYLIGRMENRTVVQLTGASFGLIETACGLARDLEPAMVVLEDVDLIGEERSHPGAVTPLLFELLNQMDGLAGDADVLFVLTTNRPDLLEPALAARPGRVDQAIELPLPDADGRRRLIDLYGRGLELGVTDLDPIVAGSEGGSPALIRELLRRAAVLAAEERDGPIKVEDRHLVTALDELSVEGKGLRRELPDEAEWLNFDEELE